MSDSVAVQLSEKALMISTIQELETRRLALVKEIEELNEEKQKYKKTSDYKIYRKKLKTATEKRLKEIARKNLKERSENIARAGVYCDYCEGTCDGCSGGPYYYDKGPLRNSLGRRR